MMYLAGGVCLVASGILLGTKGVGARGADAITIYGLLCAGAFLLVI